MGKTKTFTESDADALGAFRPASSTPRPRQVSNTPRPGGSRRSDSHTPRRADFGGEIPPVPVLVRLIWVRLRRALLVLRYRANSLTFGAFRQHGLVKVGILVMVAYFTLPGLGRDNAVAGGGEEQGISLFGLFRSDEKSSEKTGKAQKTKYKSKNDAAPVSAGELFEQEAAAYIDRFHQIAQTEQQKYGVPASISLAQGLIESRAGTSKLAQNNNNHFGMKCFSRHCKKGHCSNFTDDTHKDFFRKYQNPWESWRAHSEMLSKGRYRSLHKYGSNYKQWAYGLKSIGYATDRNYAEKLIGVIERYDLHRFD